MRLRRKATTRKPAAVMVTVVMAAVLVLLSCPPLAADPVQDKKNQLEQIKNEVQRIDAQLEAVTEQYNMTNLRLEQARARIAQKERELAALNAALEERKDILGQRMRELYKAGNADVLEVLTECRNVDDLYTNVDRARRISGNDVEVIAEVISARGEVESARNDLEEQKAELDAISSDLAAQKSRIESDLQRRQSLMAGVEADVNRLIAEEAANRPAATYRSTPSYTSRPIPPPPPPPPYAPKVVQVAYAQIGKPYQYAGSGPNVFDCSGLVMYCYAQVGVSLPHSSYMQAGLGVPVSYDQLQPGDLVFFHGNGHVGMYVGDGQYIHAPHTGDVVRVANLGSRRDFCGARRII